MADSASPSAQTKVDHLCVLVHGLWGNPQHLTFLRDTLQSQYEESGLEILLPESNRDYFTYDGIEVGGERITHEVEDRLRQLKESGSTVSKISIIGYSLGGLVARYAIGLLYKAGVFETTQPTNFTTFATPHLGVRTPSQSYKAQTWNFLGSRTLSTSGQQMFLVDNFRDSGRRLLEIMADPNSIFVKGLRQFKNRSVYANTINDRSVPFYTAAMSRTDPFVDLDAIETHFLDGQGDDTVLLDPRHPVSPRKAKEDEQTTWQNWALSEPTRRVLPFYLFFFSIIPIAIPLFLVNAGYQTYRSAQRVKLHEESQIIDLKRYRVPFLEEAQVMQDRILEQLAGERTNRGEEYLSKPVSKEGKQDSAMSSDSDDGDITKVDADHKGPFPVLALADEQFTMIDNLNSVGFTKYFAHITKARHTHAAIVVRMARESFAEGRVVVRHWARQFEV